MVEIAEGLHGEGAMQFQYALALVFALGAGLVRLRLAAERLLRMR